MAIGAIGEGDRTESNMKKNKGILWRVLFVILVLIFFAVLELGKHTILGWIWATIVFALFYIFRSTKLKEAKRGIRFLSWICMLVLCGVVIWVSWPPVKRVPAVEGNPEKTEVVHLAQGDLTGVYTKDGEVEIYAGIPYAKPPVGELRWREPQPAEGWEGVLEADAYAPMSMQVRNLPIYDSLSQIIGYHDYEISLTDNYREAVSEDSLYLNIWKPKGTAEEKLPVLVFIHGGSLQTGNSWYKDHCGEGLARDNGIIVVEMAYRLGVFGFLGDPELVAESTNGTTGNYGLLDQILALKWVRDNIAAFGGDPGNVTLSGESAGSACVSALCTSPLAKGLFRRVLAESSTVTSPEPAHSFRLLDEAFETASETKAKYGVSSVEELRAVPAEKLVGEQEVHHHMTVDGYVLPETPYESYKKGIYNEEAQMHGFNLEEAVPFLIFDPTSMKNYEEKVRDAFEEPYASEILELYPATTDEEAATYWQTIFSVYFFQYGHFCLARLANMNNIPTYMYHFTKDNGRLGTWHSGEEVYFYGNIPPSSNLYTEEDRNLSEMIRTYLVNYLKTGDPNGEGVESWKKTDGLSVQELGTEITETPTPYQELYRIFDEMYEFNLK